MFLHMFVILGVWPIPALLLFFVSWMDGSGELLKVNIKTGDGAQDFCTLL